MSRSTARRISTIGFVGLVLLHLDSWRPQRSRLLFDWLPEELAYRLALILLAWLFMLFVCSKLWREPAD